MHLPQHTGSAWIKTGGSAWRVTYCSLLSSGHDCYFAFWSVMKREKQPLFILRPLASWSWSGNLSFTHRDASRRVVLRRGATSDNANESRLDRYNQFIYFFKFVKFYYTDYNGTVLFSLSSDGREREARTRHFTCLKGSWEGKRGNTPFFTVWEVNKFYYY